MSTDVIRDTVIESIRTDLDQIEEKVMTPSLADLIRHGAAHTKKQEGWGGGDTACALSAAALAGVALGVIDEAR